MHPDLNENGRWFGNGAKIPYELYPNPNNVGGVIRYLEHGIPPGSFVAAVIRNDLKETFANADSTNGSMVKEIVGWWHQNAPIHPQMTWGSEDAYYGYLGSFERNNAKNTKQG